jgi:hypothetical protein
VLDYIAGNARVLVRDTRGSMPGCYLIVDGLPARMLMGCDAHTSRQQLERVAAAEVSMGSPHSDAVIETALQQAERMRIPILRPDPASVSTVDAAIAWLMEHDLMVTEGERYLSLACSVSTPARWLDRGRADADEIRDIAATRKVVLEGVA